MAATAIDATGDEARIFGDPANASDETIDVIMGDLDRRRFHRVKVNLLGRCMLDNGREFPCQAVNISPGGAAIISPFPGQIGHHVVAYVDNIGRIEGEISRLFDGGFAMTISASDRKRDRLADALTWIANRHLLNLPEDRRHTRKPPRQSTAVLTLADGTEHPCEVIDMSLSGAGLSTSLELPKGTAVRLGKFDARVARIFDGGIAIEFTQNPTEETIDTEYF